MTASISFKMTLWCRLTRWDAKAIVTEEYRWIPRSVHPLMPLISINMPCEVHLSKQKEALAQLWIFTLLKEAARVLYYKRFFQVQEPREKVFETDHKEPFRIKFLLTQLTQRDGWFEWIRHSNFRQLTMFASERGRNPRPPSDFGLQTSLQATLAFFVLSSGPDQRKAAHILYISSMQADRRRKTEIQKFVRLWITEAMSWRQPAKDKYRAVQQLMRFLTFSIKGV